MSKIKINGSLDTFINVMKMRNGQRPLIFERRDEITTEELTIALSSLESVVPGQFIDPAYPITTFLNAVEPTIENYREIISVLLNPVLNDTLILQGILPFSLDRLVGASIDTRSPEILEILSLELGLLDINQLPGIIRKFVDEKASSTTRNPSIAISKALHVMTHMNHKFMQAGALTPENVLIQLKMFDALRTEDASLGMPYNKYYLELVNSMRAGGAFGAFLNAVNSNPEILLLHLKHQSTIVQEAIKYNFSLLPESEAIGYTESLFSLIRGLDAGIRAQINLFATQIILKTGQDTNNWPLLIHLIQNHECLQYVDSLTIRQCADSLDAGASAFYNSLLPQQPARYLNEYSTRILHKLFQAAYNSNEAPNIASIVHFYEFIFMGTTTYFTHSYEASFPGISKLLMENSGKFRTDSMNYIKANFEKASDLANVKFLTSLFLGEDVIEGLPHPIKIYEVFGGSGVNVQRLLEKLGTNILYYNPVDGQNLFEILIDRYPEVALPLNFASLNLVEKDHAVLTRTLNYAATRNHHEAAKQILYLLKGSAIENHILESRWYGDNISLFFASHATEAEWIESLDVLYQEFSSKRALSPEEILYLRSFCLAPQINADEFSCILKLSAERFDILKFFVDNAILNINAQSTEHTHYTALAHYVDIGDVNEVVQFITTFRDKVDFNASEKQGYTPMMLAVAHGNLSIAQLLYALHPNKDECKKYADLAGYNLLHVAAEYGHIHIIDWLMHNLPELKDAPTTCLFNITDIALQNSNIYAAMHLMSKYTTSYTSTVDIMADCDALLKTLMSRSPEEQAARTPKINQTIEFVVLTTHALITGTFEDLARKLSHLKETPFLSKLSEYAKPYMDALRDSTGFAEEGLHSNLAEKFRNESLETHMGSPQYPSQLVLKLEDSVAVIDCVAVAFDSAGDDVAESKEGDDDGFAGAGVGLGIIGAALFDDHLG